MCVVRVLGLVLWSFFFFFFFNDTATTEIYTLSLHDALPIFRHIHFQQHFGPIMVGNGYRSEEHTSELQSRGLISYAVFCLKKKKNNHNKGRLVLQTRLGPSRVHDTDD